MIDECCASLEWIRALGRVSCSWEGKDWWFLAECRLLNTWCWMVGSPWFVLLACCAYVFWCHVLELPKYYHGVCMVHIWRHIFLRSLHDFLLRDSEPEETSKSRRSQNFWILSDQKRTNSLCGANCCMSIRFKQWLSSKAGKSAWRLLCPLPLTTSYGFNVLCKTLQGVYPIPCMIYWTKEGFGTVSKPIAMSKN